MDIFWARKIWLAFLGAVLILWGGAKFYIRYGKEELWERRVMGKSRSSHVVTSRFELIFYPCLLVIFDVWLTRGDGLLNCWLLGVMDVN